VAKQSPSKAGWTLDEHRAACGYSRTFYYSLPQEKRPRGVYITPRKHIITESPEEYLARLASEFAAVA
jgi:hypothetical protein